jgi:hypothetical protein
LGIKKAASTRGPGPFDSCWFQFHFSFATSRDRLKGIEKTLMRRVAAFAPFGPVLDDPIRQGPFKTDVVAGFLGFDPLVPHDLLAFRLKFTVQRRLFYQVTPVRRL